MEQSYWVRGAYWPKGLQTRAQDQEEAKWSVSYMTSCWRETLMIWIRKWSSNESSYFGEPFWEVGSSSRVQFASSTTSNWFNTFLDCGPPSKAARAFYPIIVLHACPFMVGCPTKTKLWLVLETTLHQQSLAIGLHMKNELLTTICDQSWLVAQTLAHFIEHP